jgi:hypothetical protein
MTKSAVARSEERDDSLRGELRCSAEVATLGDPVPILAFHPGPLS